MPKSKPMLMGGKETKGEIKELGKPYGKGT
jgi:hypothetical protein